MIDKIQNLAAFEKNALKKNVKKINNFYVPVKRNEYKLSMTFHYNMFKIP